MYILGLSKKLVDTANIIQNNDTFFKKVLSYLNIDLHYEYVKKKSDQCSCSYWSNCNISYYIYNANTEHTAKSGVDLHRRLVNLRVKAAFIDYSRKLQ